MIRQTGLYQPLVFCAFQQSHTLEAAADSNVDSYTSASVSGVNVRNWQPFGLWRHGEDACLDDQDGSFGPETPFSDFVDQTGNVTSTMTATPEAIAESLFQFTLRNGIDKSWLYNVISNGRALGKVEQLDCVYNADAMNDVLKHPERYGSLSDLLDTLDVRESELTDCLDIMQKLLYGIQLRQFGQDLKSRPDFFDVFTALYAKSLGITPGKGAVNLFCYFFRHDLIDKTSFEIMELFRMKLQRLLFG